MEARAGVVILPRGPLGGRTVKVAIDSYCYHRYFGEVYPGLQQPPDRTMTVWDFLRRAKQLGVDGVSLESCYFPSFEDDFLHKLRRTLDQCGFERVWGPSRRVLLRNQS